MFCNECNECMYCVKRPSLNKREMDNEWISGNSNFQLWVMLCLQLYLVSNVHSFVFTSQTYQTIIHIHRQGCLE